MCHQMMEIVHGMILVILINLKMILVILINLKMKLVMMRVEIWHEKLSVIKEV